MPNCVVLGCLEVSEKFMVGNGGGIISIATSCQVMFGCNNRTVFDQFNFYFVTWSLVWGGGFTDITLCTQPALGFDWAEF